MKYLAVIGFAVLAWAPGLFAVEPVTVTAVGDSFTIGAYGFDDPDQAQPLRSYPVQLSESLGFPVGNHGVGGWSSGRIRGEWLKNATPAEKAGIVILAAGTNNYKSTDSAPLIADVQAVLDSLTSEPRTFVLLLHPHAGEEFTPEQRANIVGHHEALLAAFPEYAIDLWDFHVDAEGIIDPAYRRYNPDGKKDGLHPNSLWYAEVAARVRERLIARGWVAKPAQQ